MAASAYATRFPRAAARTHDAAAAGKMRHFALEARALLAPRPTSGAGLVQRYRTDQDSKEKVSAGEDLLLAGERDLYAGDGQFLEANAIGGDLEFQKGPAHPRLGKLKKVLPRARPDSPLAQQTRAVGKGGRYSEEDDKAWVAQKAKESAKRSGLQALEQRHKEAALRLSDEDKLARYGTVDAEDIEVETDSAAKKELIALLKQDAEGFYSSSAAVKGLESYLAAQAGGSDPLMPSDCRAAATHIAGFDPEEGEEIEAAEAGAVYSIKPVEGRNAEWTAHYGTIIMTDRADHATMENAGGTASQGFQKLQYDRTWFFEMYGPDEGQSFGDKYGKFF